MRGKLKPGFLLVARREWRWLLHDQAARILIFGVPLFAFTVLTAVFNHPVIRELGVVVVDAVRWYMAVLLGQAARGLPLSESARPFAALATLAVLYSLLAFLRLRAIAPSVTRSAPTPAPTAAPAAPVASVAPSLPSGGVCSPSAALSSCWWLGPGLRRLLPAALSQPDLAQDPDRGRRQRPQRVE
jgi:hypothetical protein